VCFGEAEERRADLADQLQNRLTIRAAGKHPVEPEKVGGQRRLVRLKHANQFRSQAIELVGHDQYADQYLLRALRIRLT
jgi:hypothetical protein